MRVNGEQRIILDLPLDIADSKSKANKVNLRIEASHAGVLNGNLMFYTPNALKEGSESLKQFPKPLQKKHYSKTLGYIHNAEYKDNAVDTPYLKKINNSKTPEELVRVVNEYVNSSDYTKNPKGFGVLVSHATLYDTNKIKELKNKDRGTVSIAGESENAYCSICTRDVSKCGHVVGNVYQKKTCFAIVNTLGLDHISFETIPADVKSNTIIVEDSGLIGTVEIIDYNIQKGIPMKLTLSEIKEKLSNIEAFLAEINLTEFLEAYTLEASQAKANEYALPEDKLLPFNTKLTAYVTSKALELLEDSEDKPFIQAPIDEAYKGFFENLTEEEIKASLSPVVIKDLDPLEPEPALTAPVKEEPIIEPVSAKEPAVSDLTGLQVTDADRFKTEILDSVSNLVSNKLQEVVNTLSGVLTKEQEAKANNILRSQLDAAKSELANAKIFEEQLTSELHSSILSQIQRLKNLDDNDEYLVKLKNRTIQQLKQTLEDHVQFFSSNPVKQEVEAPVVAPIQDSQIPTDPATAATNMSSDETTFDITDEDKLVSGIVESITEPLNKKAFTSLYKSVVAEHGSHIAQKVHVSLKQSNKL